MGDIEIGRCDICGCENVQLLRKYFDYPNIDCLCCSPHHFELVRHCVNCIPKRPTEIKVILSDAYKSMLINKKE